MSVRVAVLDRDATAVELAQALKTSLKGRDEYSHFRDAEREVGEHQAAGLRLNVRAGDGNDYRVEQLYLVREGLQYTLEHHAPVKRFDDNARVRQRHGPQFGECIHHGHDHPGGLALHRVQQGGNGWNRRFAHAGQSIRGRHHLLRRAGFQCADQWLDFRRSFLRRWLFASAHDNQT